ncbi:hypothetical protein [Campylobacter troglodytis]|uniref:hypothetical protein n=1 Tax=Campylobacter troglodytis TaxID=654363 RepID=UPI0011574CF7|nr:hypothetical protein DMC01_12035 [Campylobacter troglodytis]
MQESFKAYDGLVDFTTLRLVHLQEGVKARDFVKHSKNEFANGRNHINGIENFFRALATA